MRTCPECKVKAKLVSHVAVTANDTGGVQIIDFEHECETHGRFEGGHNQIPEGRKIVPSPLMNGEIEVHHFEHLYPHWQKQSAECACLNCGQPVYLHSDGQTAEMAHENVCESLDSVVTFADARRYFDESAKRTAETAGT